MDTNRPEASKKRVVQLCQQLGIHENVLSYMDLKPDWEAIFSEAQQKLINIARALINNAEVICLDKPLAKFDPEQSGKVKSVLLEHVEKKGLGLTSDASTRRPRTVFLTANSPIGHAHAQYWINRDTGITLVTHEKAIQILGIIETARESTERLATEEN